MFFIKILDSGIHQKIHDELNKKRLNGALMSCHLINSNSALLSYVNIIKTSFKHKPMLIVHSIELKLIGKIFRLKRGKKNGPGISIIN